MDDVQGEPERFAGAGTTAFLDRVRSLAPERLGGLVAPADTWAVELGGPLLVVDVPGLPDGEKPVIDDHIQVLWDRGVLGGYWGCSYLWDDFDEGDEESLVVRGVPMTGAEAADKAVDGLARQLRRPIDVAVWSKGGRVVARRWTLADTGRAIGHQGSPFARRRPPTTVTRLRPAGGAAR